MSFALPLIGAGASALGSGLAGIFGKTPKPPKPKWLTPPETKLQTTQRNLIDDLLASLKGNGSYNDLFSADENTFQKSFVDPAKSLFRNQIAPQIQQQYIADGQQRNSGLEDTLARAGVDLDQMLNQQYFNMQEGAQNRQENAIARILGQQGPQPQLTTGQSPGQSSGNAFGQGIAGYISGGGLGDSIGNILRAQSNQQKKPQQNTAPFVGPRKGFELPDFNPNLGR